MSFIKIPGAVVPWIGDVIPNGSGFIKTPGVPVPWIGHVAPTPPPITGYTAAAVVFDGHSWLQCPALTAPNSPFLLTSQWLKWDAAAILIGGDVYDFSPENLEILQNHSATSMIFSTTPDGSSNLQWTVTTTVFADGNWHHVLCHTNTQTKTCVVYVDDAPLVASLSSDRDPFDQPFSGLITAVPENAVYGFLQRFKGEAADFFLAPGFDLDLSVEANRRLFIDGSGKPVNPTTAVAALGTPAILFSGDATGFVFNEGSGGTFAVTGTITNASTSPSG